MLCYECSTHGTNTPAIALCHHCLAGLCPTHALQLEHPLSANDSEPASPPRVFLCPSCRPVSLRAGDQAHTPVIDQRFNTRY